MASVVCEVIKHMMYKIDIANIYLGILLHYLLVLAAVLIFGYAFNWVNQLPVYVLAGMWALPGRMAVCSTAPAPSA